MKYLSKLLFILLPTCLPLLLFSFIAKHYTEGSNGKQSEVIDVVYTLISFYRTAMPVLLVVAILVQYLIILPIWNSGRPWAIKTMWVFILVAVCLGLSILLSYIIWDTNDGVSWIFKVTIAITAMQLAYWLLNFIFLYILSLIIKDKSQISESHPDSHRDPNLTQ
jgi:nicotinamide riboside transporter PnuC